METPQDVRDWYRQDSYNTRVFRGDGTTRLSDNYRVACTIPQGLIDLLSSRQSSRQTYLGSNLSVLEQADGTTLYDLYFYTYRHDATTNRYLVGRTVYALKNVEPGYRRFLCSSSYLVLDITAEDIDFSVLVNTQAYKQDDNVGTLRLDLRTGTDVYFSILDIYTRNTRKRYGVLNGKGINFYSSTPVYTYRYLSRTKSTCVFADEIVKRLEDTAARLLSLSQQTDDFPAR